MTWRQSGLQSNRMNEHKNQPTPPEDSYRHSFPRGKEGIIARLLSARGLCYKETNLSCERTWRASYCIEISEAQFNGEGGWKKNLSENDTWGLQEDATKVSRDWRRRAFLTVGVGEAHWSQITVSTTKLLAMWRMEWQPSTLRLLIPERGDEVKETEDTHRVRKTELTTNTHAQKYNH